MAQRTTSAARSAGNTSESFAPAVGRFPLPFPFQLFSQRMPQVLERPSASPVMVWHYSDRPKLPVGLTTGADGLVCKQKSFYERVGSAGGSNTATRLCFERTGRRGAVVAEIWSRLSRGVGRRYWRAVVRTDPPAYRGRSSVALIRRSLCRRRVRDSLRAGISRRASLAGGLPESSNTLVSQK